MIKRRLTPDQVARFKRVCALARLLDDSYLIPGTNQRVGVDALIGLIPVAGDVITTVLAAYIVREAAAFGVSKRILFKMLFNLAVDFAVGAVPIAGDAFDLIWKANRKNVDLLIAHLKSEGYLDEGDFIDV